MLPEDASSSRKVIREQTMATVADPSRRARHTLPECGRI